MKLTTYRDVEIEVVASTGYFTAKVEDASLAAETLTELQAKIDKEFTANVKKATISLAVCFISRQQYSYLESAQLSVARGVLSGVNRTSGKAQITNLTKDEVADYILPDTDENHDLLMEYAKTQASLLRLRRQIEKRIVNIEAYGRTSAGDYPYVLAKIEKSYQASIAQAAEKAETK